MLRSHIGVKKPGELSKDRLDRKARRPSDEVSSHSINIGSLEERKHMVFIPSVRRLEDMETPEALPPPPSATSQPPLGRSVIANNGNTRASPSRPAPRRKTATDGHVDSRLAVPGAVVKGLVNSVPTTAAVNSRSLGPMDGGKEGSLRGESAKEAQDAIDAVQLSLARLQALRNVLCRANLVEGDAPIGQVEDSHDTSLREASLREASSQKSVLRDESMKDNSMRKGNGKVEGGGLAAASMHTHKGVMAPCQGKGRLEDSGIERLGGASLEKAYQNAPRNLNKGGGGSKACGGDMLRSKQEGRAGVAAEGQGGSIDAQASARDMAVPSQGGRHEEILRQARMEALKRILARQQEGAAAEEGEGGGWRRDKEEVERRSAQERDGERRRAEEAVSEKERQKETILQQARVEALRRVLGGRVPGTAQSEKPPNRAVTISTSTILDKGSVSSTTVLHSPALAMAHPASATAIVQQTKPPQPHITAASSFTPPPQASSLPISSSSTISVSSRLAVCPTATLPQDPPRSIKPPARTAPSQAPALVTSSSTAGGSLQTLEIGPMSRQSSASVGPSMGPSCPPPASSSERRGQCASASAVNKGEGTRDEPCSPLSTQAVGSLTAMCGEEKGLLVGLSSEPCGEAESGPLSPASVGCGKEGGEGGRTRLGLKRRRQCTSLPSDHSTDLVQSDPVVALGDDAHFYSCAKGTGKATEGKGKEGPVEGAQEQSGRDTGDANGRERGDGNVPTNREEGRAGEGRSGNQGGRKEEGKGGRGPSAEAARPAGAKQRHRRLRKREIQCLTVRNGRSGARLQHVMVYGRYDAAVFDRFAFTPNRNRYIRLATSPADGPTPPPPKAAAAAGKKAGATALKTKGRSSAVAAATIKAAASRPVACKTGARKVAAAAEERQAAGVMGDKGPRGVAVVKVVPLSNGGACNMPACMDRNEATGACSPSKACARRDQSFRRFLEQRASADRR